MIGNNISKLDECKDSIFFRANCGCGYNECNHDLWLEKSDGMLLLGMEILVPKLSLWERLKVLFIGRWKYYYDFYFKNEESINDYINALCEGLEYIRKDNK